MLRTMLPVAARLTTAVMLAVTSAAALWMVVPVSAISSTIVVSEFRTRGPAGATDEFVELFNASSVAIDISNWKLGGSSNTAPTGTRATIPASTLLGPGCHYLFASSGYSGTALPDATYTTGISDNGGVAVIDTNSAIVDQVGVTTTGTAYREGTPLATQLTNNDRSYERKPGGAAGNATDTDDNSADFVLLAVGTTNPQNRNSPCIGVTPTPPTGVGSSEPPTANPGNSILLKVAATAGANPPSTGIGVVADLSAAGGSATQAFFDDGLNGDATANDGVFSFVLNTSVSISTGTYTVPFTVTDGEGRSSTGSFTFAIQISGPQDIVVSQVYGGGGNSGATLKNDYIELFNRGLQTASLSGWSVQYLTASGTGNWQVTSLNGAIGPGQYYLVQEAQGTSGSVNLPIPDAIGTIPLAATGGHVALVNNISALPSNSCQSLPGVVDFVGFGGAVCHEGGTAAPAPSNTRAVFRVEAGCADTDNNAADFTTGTPFPRNRQVSHTCGTTEPPVVPIDQIQGTGVASSYAGQRVTTSGVVTGLKSNGFYLQTPDTDIDADSNTSEGVFVFTGGAPGRAITDYVTVTGTVQEFVPSADTASPPVTELTSPTVTLFSTGSTLPSPITLTPIDTMPGGGVSQLEKYEGMRVSIDSLTVIAPTAGSTNEANATGSTNGVFYGVLTGLQRPMREPGIDILDPLPTGAPPTVTRYDGNPERIRVDSDAQPGAAALDLTTGTTVTGLVGPLDYSFRTYTVLPDAATPPGTTPNMSAIPVSAAAADEFTVASFNMERFFDTVDDPGISDVALTPAAFAGRLNKASLAIRTVMRMPDIIGVEEMENLPTLQAVASKVNADAVAAGGADPHYEAILVEGNDIGGIDVGFLVRTDRVTIGDYLQFGKDVTYINPNNSQAELLNDRPSLLLHATVHLPGGVPYPASVIVNHLRSLSGVDDPADGNRVRVKRRAQAEYLAGYVQSLQQADPGEHIVLVGDFNAFQFNDGYVDVIGTILGTPTPPDQVTLASLDLVNPDLIDLVNTVPQSERYSFVFDGIAQELDHVLITSTLQSAFSRLEYARNDADFPEKYRSDTSRPERISDHDMVVAYFRVPLTQSTSIAVADSAGEAALPTTLTATLTTGSTARPVAGETLTFTVNGLAVTGITDTSGVATAVVTIGSPGPYQVVATFAGHGVLLGSSGFGTLTLADTTPPTLNLPGDMTVEATSPSGTPVSFVASAVDRVDGVVPVTCSPTSGSLFPFGATIVHCHASDSHGNEATGAFTVTVTAADTPGLMLGVGFIAAPGQRHDFAFLVGENGTEGGALEYVVHVREGWRERQDRFRTTAVTSVSFFDAPGTAPGPLPQPTIDQVVFAGVGTWNGTAGYTFTAQALDAGEPGRGRDMFAITVRDGAGHLVASVNARISLGNVESYFVPR